MTKSIFDKNVVTIVLNSSRLLVLGILSDRASKSF